MENILEKINELHAVYSTELAGVRKERADLSRRIKEYDELGSTLLIKKKELEGREVEVKKIEDVISFQKEANKSRQDADQKISELRGLIQEYEEKKKAFQIESNMEKAEIQKQREALRKNELIYRDNLAKLEEEKKAYKEQVMDEIKRKIG